MMIRESLAVLLIVLFLSSLLNAYPVERGERPPIDLAGLGDDAYYQGHIRIKIDQDFTVFLDSQSPFYDDHGIVNFGIEAIDALSRDFGVRKAYWLYDPEMMEAKYSDRHRAWGFHLWYEIHFPRDVAIPEVIAAYASLSEISAAEPEYRKELYTLFDNASRDTSILRWTPNDPNFYQQWSYHNTGQSGGTPGADVSMVNAWNIEKGHSDVIIAILDQGIDYNHVDLAGNMWPYVGYNYYSNSMTVSPGEHGTLVAGVVSAASNNGLGIAGIAGGSGSNNGVRLMSCQIVSGNNFNNIHLGIIGAADLGAAINQNSWGYVPAGAFEQIVLDAIDYFNANGGGNVMNGGITIFAAGNQNSSANWYPACYSGSYAVAATNNQDIKAGYSNYGNWVDISAPGGETHIFSARGILSTNLNNAYTFVQGTSIAAPHVTGASALIISHAYRYGVLLDNTTVTDILSDTTDDHYAQNSDYLGQLGSGRLNAHAALLLTQTYLGTVHNPALFTAEPTGFYSIDLQWEKNNNLDNVLVVWSDEPLLGNPVDGLSYTAGQELPGGGTVLYSGGNASFSHTDLQESTTYYYRAFSYTAAYHYSSGREAQASTHYIALALPFGENFNHSSYIPNLWQVIDHNGLGQRWDVGIMTYSGLSGTTGNYAYINSFAYGSGYEQDTDLITPKMNLSTSQDVILTFAHYFRRGNNDASGTLAYSINDGATWVTIETWTQTTANPAYFYETIPQVAGHTEVRFKWKYEGIHDRNWCIDDVIIAEAASIGSIEGTVTLIDGIGDVTQVTVAAHGFSTHPDVNGHYSLPLLPGSYAVKASLDYYQTGFIDDVIVEPEGVTAGVDFELQFVSPPAPQYLNATPQDNYSTIFLVWYLEPISHSAQITGREESQDSRDSGRSRNMELLGFNLYRNEQLLNSEPIPETQYYDSDFEYGQTYTYHVTALYDIGESESSNSVTVNIPPRVATPLFSPEAGYYEEQILIDISCDTPDALIYYTLNGTDPTQSSLLFQEPFLLGQTTTVKARAFKSQWLNSDIAVAVYEFPVGIEADLPYLETRLHGAYPNPFNPDTNIRFSLADPARVTLKIYNIAGQNVRTLVAEQEYQQGDHRVLWNGKDAEGRPVASGLYFSVMQTSDGFLDVKKMALIK